LGLGLPCANEKVQLRISASDSAYSQRRGLASQTPPLTGELWSGTPTKRKSDDMNAAMCRLHTSRRNGWYAGARSASMSTWRSYAGTMEQLHCTTASRTTWGCCGGTVEGLQACSTRSKLSENIANLSSAVCTSATRIAWLAT